MARVIYNNAAHIGGIVTGFIIGLILNPQLRQKMDENEEFKTV